MKRLLCVLLAGLMAMSLFACGKKAAPEQSGDPVAQSSITALQYSDDNVLVRFTRVDGTWKWADGLDFPLDDTFVLQLEKEIGALLQAESIGTIEDAATYGFENAQKYIAVTNQDKTVRLSFGKQNAEGKWYMTRDDQPEAVYLADDQLVQKLSTSIYDMALLPTLPAFTQENLCTVTLDQEEGLHLHLTAKDGEWTASGKKVKADDLQKELENLTVTKCVDYHPTAGAMSLCGFNTPLSITVSYVNSVGSMSDWVLKIGGEAIDGEGFYVTVGEDSTIYEMPKDHLTSVLQLAADNRQELSVDDAELEENN